MQRIDDCTPSLSIVILLRKRRLGTYLNNFAHAHNNVKQVYLPFYSEEKVQNRFLTWLLGQPSWISDQNDLAIFDLQVTLILPIKFRVNWPFCSGEQVQNRF